MSWRGVCVTRGVPAKKDSSSRLTRTSKSDNNDGKPEEAKRLKLKLAQLFISSFSDGKDDESILYCIIYYYQSHHIVL